MKIAFIIFNEITWLDFIGIYEPITKLKSLNYMPDLTWDICSFTNIVADSFGLEIKPSNVKTQLTIYDVVIIPGGVGVKKYIDNEEFMDWIRTIPDCNLKISICTGSLILGKAGFLTDKKATTHYIAYEDLRPYCKEVLSDRIVEDGDIITAGGVSASIDLGLHLCKKWAGAEAELEIRKRMDYQG